jgi:hypothetical protein
VNRGNLVALTVAVVLLIALPRIITHEFYINMAASA